MSSKNVTYDLQPDREDGSHSLQNPTGGTSCALQPRSYMKRLVGSPAQTADSGRISDHVHVGCRYGSKTARASTKKREKK